MTCLEVESSARRCQRSPTLLSPVSSHSQRIGLRGKKCRQRDGGSFRFSIGKTSSIPALLMAEMAERLFIEPKLPRTRERTLGFRLQSHRPHADRGVPHRAERKA